MNMKNNRGIGVVEILLIMAIAVLLILILKPVLVEAVREVYRVWTGFFGTAGNSVPINGVA